MLGGGLTNSEPGTRVIPEQSIMTYEIISCLSMCCWGSSEFSFWLPIDSVMIELFSVTVTVVLVFLSYVVNS